MPPPASKKRPAANPLHPMFQKCYKKSPTVKMDPTTYKVMDLVIKSNIVNWNDVMNLGAMCKESRKLYKASDQEALFAPLLQLLQRLTGPFRDSYQFAAAACDTPFLPSATDHSLLDKVTRWDPRFEPDYEHWSTMKKCKALARFRQSFSFTDPTNPKKCKATRGPDE